MGESPGEFLAATAHLELVFQVICIFCLHRALRKIHTWKLFALNLVYGEIKNRKKKSLGKEKEKNSPKEDRNIIILSRKQENPC